MRLGQSNPSFVAPIEDIRAFCVVARAGSYSAAAEALNTAHSSLSRRVSHLEHWLGFRLFHRTGRGVVLTAEGEQFFRKCQRGLLAIDEAILDARDTRRKVEVVVSTLEAFAHFWLLPRFPSFGRKEDRYEIRIRTTQDITDFRDGADLAVRYGAGVWPGTTSVALWEEWAQPMAAPAILGPNPPVQPEDLLNYPLIHVRTDAVWQQWFAVHGVPFAHRRKDHVFQDQILAFEAVKAGLGIGLNRPLLAHVVNEADFYFGPFGKVQVDSTYHLVRPRNGSLRKPAQFFAQDLLSDIRVDAQKIARFLSTSISKMDVSTGL